MSASEAAADDAVLDYEVLVEQYNDALFATLRHHRSAAYLDTWVPDPDPVRSLLNMVEAAEIAGVSRLDVRIGARTCASVDREELRRALAPLARTTLIEDGDALRLQVEAIGGRSGSELRADDDVFAAVSPAYRTAIRAAAGSGDHEGNVADPDAAHVVAASCEGLTLEVSTDARHVIRAAAFRNAHSRAERSAMERLCALLPGLTIQEANDHAAIRLEHALRAPEHARPVAGVVQPENADPLFVRPARLLRNLGARYAETTDVRLGANTYAARPSAEWLALGRDDQLRRVDAFFGEHAASAGLAAGQVRAVDVEQQIRVLVAFREDVPVARKPATLMRLERALHALEPALQLFSVELKDANKTRRL